MWNKKTIMPVALVWHVFFQQNVINRCRFPPEKKRGWVSKEDHLILLENC